MDGAELGDSTRATRRRLARLTRVGRGAWARLGLACALTASLDACSWDYDRPEGAHRSQFYGPRALLAADEPGEVFFSMDYSHRQQDLSVLTDPADYEAHLGYRTELGYFGAFSINTVILGAAPDGYRTTLELHYQGELLDNLRIEYASEGEAGLRSADMLGLDVLGSEDPRGAACVVEHTDVFAIFTRRATDGRVLDSPFPEDAEPSVAGGEPEISAALYHEGAQVYEIRALSAGTHSVSMVSSQRAWDIDVRVVREDELVTLELYTARAHGFAPGLAFAVLRTADGCPVLGTSVTLEVHGVRTTVRSDGFVIDPETVSEGDEITVEFGDLSTTVIY